MTALKNSYLSKFDEKLKIYDSIFFKTVDGQGVLLNEVSKITELNNLNIPVNINDTTSYNTSQFGNFIRNIINFNIKNYDVLNDKDNNMGFVMKSDGRDGSKPGFSFNENVKNNIIETLKVVNVFVDILEAYKHCIDNGGKSFESGYTDQIDIERIELVSDKTRFYASSTMAPVKELRNIGYIRPIKEDRNRDGTFQDIKVLYLSIQSFDTNMETSSLNYNNMFQTNNGSKVTANTNILHSNSYSNKDTGYALADNTYNRQVYSGIANDPPSTINLTLEKRNKALIVFLLKTLFNLDINFRAQSVYALYYYYKFVQLYSTLIINVSNVMYNDVKEDPAKKSLYRIDTRNMSTNMLTATSTHGVSGIEIKSASLSSVSSGSQTIVLNDDTGTAIANDLELNNKIFKFKFGGTGHKHTPTVVISGASGLANATIVPIVTENVLTNDENIEKLRLEINNISNTLTELMTWISNYSATNDNSCVISTLDSDTNPTKVSLSLNNKVILNITKNEIYKVLNRYNEKYDLVSDYIIYDTKHKVYYNILNITDEMVDDFKIEINAVFNQTDILGGENNSVDQDTKIFKNGNGGFETKQASAATMTNTASASFLEIRRKDIIAYKSEYIYNREDISKLNEIISYNTSKVAHQKSLYDTQFNKNIFLERQILVYNIIIAIIILVLAVINILKIDTKLVKTISLSCFGAIILLFVIYFISNITYLETFALAGGDALKALTKSQYDTDKISLSEYNNRKIKTLNEEINKLNSKFISYFEKIIITIPSADNLDFFREIKDVITNDKNNKDNINKHLEYSKSQNINDLNALKYDLENNKLYINTLLISAIIFIGLYNMYVNYITNEKYLSLILFICTIIFIIIVSYYIINSNRRVKTVFKSIYWGPEFSKNF